LNFARHITTLEDEATVSAALARAGRELIGALDGPSLVGRLCELAVELLGARVAHVVLRQADGVFVPAAGLGFGQEAEEGLRLLRVPESLLTPVLARFAHDDCIEVGQDALSHPSASALLGRHGVTRMTLLPLRRSDEVVGFLSLGFGDDLPPPGAAERGIALGLGQLGSMVVAHALLQERADELARLKSEFVATMSHELRTPLNVILGYTEILGDPRSQREHALAVSRVRHATLELLELVEGTLDLGRLESGRDPVQRVPVSVATLWADLHLATADLPRHPGVGLTLHAPPAVEFQTDPRKLRTVLKNLIHNGLKFTKAGHVDVRCRLAGAACAFSVADTGVGIEAADLPHVFEMFRRGAEAGHLTPGVGLGLYIVARLCEQLGARITVESEPGRGSTFTVTVPLAP
jgi:signal transduction histidine kinase